MICTPLFYIVKEILVRHDRRLTCFQMILIYSVGMQQTYKILHYNYYLGYLNIEKCEVIVVMNNNYRSEGLNLPLFPTPSRENKSYNICSKNIPSWGWWIVVRSGSRSMSTSIGVSRWSNIKSKRRSWKKFLENRATNDCFTYLIIIIDFMSFSYPNSSWK